MSEQPNTQYFITASGYITPNPGTFVLNSPTPLIVEIPLPIADGIQIKFMDVSGQHHQLVFDTAGSPPTQGLNGGAGAQTYTFPIPGWPLDTHSALAIEMTSYGGSWWSMLNMQLGETQYAPGYPVTTPYQVFPGPPMLWVPPPDWAPPPGVTMITASGDIKPSGGTFLLNSPTPLVLRIPEPTKSSQ
jgi:hypothetical protein